MSETYALSEELNHFAESLDFFFRYIGYFLIYPFLRYIRVACVYILNQPKRPYWLFVLLGCTFIPYINLFTLWYCLWFLHEYYLQLPNWMKTRFKPM